MRYPKIFLTISLLFMTSTSFAQQKMEKLVLAGPKAPVTPPLAYIVEHGLLNDIAEKVELRIWKNPDQLKSLIISKQVHFTAAASQVAAKLYNKGLPLKLLNISIWGDYWLMSNDPKVKTLHDLKGKEIGIPFRSGTPTTVMKLLTQKMGMDLDKDFNIKYLPNFGTALQEISSGTVANGFLTEPQASIAVIKTKDKKNRVYKAVDLTKLWGELYNTEPRVARAGMVVLPEIVTDKEVIAKFQAAYKNAIIWCNKHPKEAGILAEKYIPGFKAQAVTMSLKTGTVQFENAQDARASIEKFYAVLMQQNPKTIGGKLPDNNFYYQ